MNACVTLPVFSSPEKGHLGGKLGLRAAPTAKTTIRAFLTPVDVSSSKTPGDDVMDDGVYGIEITFDICTKVIETVPRNHILAVFWNSA